MCNQMIIIFVSRGPGLCGNTVLNRMWQYGKRVPFLLGAKLKIFEKHKEFSDFVCTFAVFRILSTIYNQIVKEMHVNFSERKTMALMLRLEKATKEITALAKDVISLAHTTRRINFTSDDYV